MLKPCPFCGGEAELREICTQSASLQCVRCKECQACSQKFMSYSEAANSEAVTAWNRRETLISRLKRRLIAWLKS